MRAFEPELLVTRVVSTGLGFVCGRAGIAGGFIGCGSAVCGFQARYLASSFVRRRFSASNVATSTCWVFEAVPKLVMVFAMSILQALISWRTRSARGEPGRIFRNRSK